MPMIDLLRQRLRRGDTVRVNRGAKNKIQHGPNGALRCLYATRASSTVVVQ